MQFSERNNIHHNHLSLIQNKALRKKPHVYNMQTEFKPMTCYCFSSIFIKTTQTKKKTVLFKIKILHPEILRLRTFLGLGLKQEYQYRFAVFVWLPKKFQKLTGRTLSVPLDRCTSNVMILYKRDQC